MSHTCHAPGCNRLVPAKMFACRDHWFALPKDIRDAIWHEYRDGQEISKRPSLRYLAVQRLACARLAFKPHDEEAARVAADLMFQAIAFRKSAIELGQGDPLFGLIPAGLPHPKARRKRASTVRKATSDG